MEKLKKGNIFTSRGKRVAALALAFALTFGSNAMAVAQGTVESQAVGGLQDGCRVQPTNLEKRDYASRNSWKRLKATLTFYMANDLGRNGYYDQKPIAELMGEMAGTADPQCVIAAGDIHHFNGVASVSDPLWLTNYETVYSHPDLMIDWFPVCGNHEYRGNTQAVLDYSKISRRWMMPSKYYSKVFSKKGVSVRIVFLDTTPLIDKYRTDKEVYPDACKQDMQAQLDWLDRTLKEAKEDWTVVVGHHPIFAYTEKSESERTDMQKRVLPILRRYGNVAIYACGHIHSFQHLRMKDDDIDYVVNSSASLARPVKAVEGTVFCSSADGFSVISADKKQLRMQMIDNAGNIIHEIVKTK